MRIRSEADLRRVIDEPIPEGPSLEFKQTLDLARESDRKEVLKDVTGMGNGGGGRIVYGLAEEGDTDAYATALTALTDAGLVGRLEDITRTVVRPPLLARFERIDVNDGYVLVVEVSRSPLGPYMVEGYGERRYYTRQGSRTFPMTEQEVRDQYALAGRARDNRPQLWSDHLLPPEVGKETPWLILSALPEEPLREVLDPLRHPAHSFRPEPLLSGMRAYADAADLSGATNQIRIWSDGLAGDDSYGERQPTTLFRIHRDGAMTHATQFGQQIGTWTVCRALNAQLAFVAWAWERVDLINPVEIDARLENLAIARVQPLGWMDDEKEPVQPLLAPEAAVVLRREVLPAELLRASVRHDIVRAFADRLEQAFGRVSMGAMFDYGWLYAANGGTLGVSIYKSGVWSSEGQQLGFVDDAGRITNPAGRIVGYFTDGVVLDGEGRAMATLEMATSPGLPDDFKLHSHHPDPRPRVPGSTAADPKPAGEKVDVPAPLGEWSSQSLTSLLSDPGDPHADH